MGSNIPLGHQAQCESYYTYLIMDEIIFFSKNELWPFRIKDLTKQICSLKDNQRGGGRGIIGDNGGAIKEHV